jgi:hypothetical protein
VPTIEVKTIESYFFKPHVEPLLYSVHV